MRLDFARGNLGDLLFKISFSLEFPQLIDAGISAELAISDPRWFYECLKPYEPYVPIKNDLSDLVDQIVWAQTHDELCLQISQTATRFAENHLMFDDVYCYLYRFFMTYSTRQDASLKKTGKLPTQPLPGHLFSDY